MGCGNSNSIENVKVKESVSNKNKPFLNHSYFIMENEKQVKDNYIIKNKLGEGASGVVRRIVDKTTGEEKALKILPKLSANKEQESLLMTEIDILKSLDHPSIIKMYEFYQDKKNFYIVTEVVKGGELFEKIVDFSQFNESDAAFIFSQMISVVQYAHENKIMHRDLKPENILLEYNPDQKNTKFAIKVIDWGSSTEFSEKKQTKQVGTPYYLAPEVLKNNYNEKCDVWTCGVILYIMLTGEPPFFGNNNEIVQRILEIKYDFDQDIWKAISQECKEIIKLMICSEENRLTAKQVQEHPWMKNNLAIFKSEKESESQKDQNIKQLSKLKKFTTKNQLHSAALTYITTQLSSKEDVKQFKEIFEKLDKNNDGSLTKQEIESGFQQYQEFFHSDYDVEKIFQNVDQDKNGKINFSEFIVACINQEDAQIESKLKKAFEMFDSDGNNFITNDELNELFATTLSEKEKTIKDILSQYDQNSDGQISFEEFKNMMKKYTEN